MLMQFLTLPRHPIYLQTPRLILRPLSLSDAQDVFDYSSNPNVTRYNDCEPFKTLEESIEFIKFTHTLNADNSLCFLGIVEKKSNKVIGTAGLFRRADLSRWTLELGYSLGENAWGKGYATEAVQTLINYAFAILPELERIEATCLTPNLASVRVLEKIGMQREGVLRNYYKKNGYFYHSYQYSLLRQEHEARQRELFDQAKESARSLIS